MPLAFDGLIEMKGGEPLMNEAYCVKCREKREMKDTETVTMKNGRNAVKGSCSVCGTKMFKILGKAA
jgi:hypothetical protein